MKAYKESPKQPGTPRGVEVEITRETKALPPLPASFNASSKDEERMEWLIPDEGMVPTNEDAWKQESEDTKRWEREETVRLILEIMKEREKSKELAEQQNAQNERNSRNALIGSFRMATSTVVQEILMVRTIVALRRTMDLSVTVADIAYRMKHTSVIANIWGQVTGKRFFEFRPRIVSVDTSIVTYPKL